MNPTKQQAFDKISSLVERFREHHEEYKRGTYNEQQTRVDYINPFFKALGWDMDNEQGHAEAYREVIHEDKLKVGGATKAPDYAFTLSGQRKFFVDAKKPGINIKADIGPAYQVRRYGWSAKVPLSVVTDFEEFAIYDCTKKPNPGDKSSVSRIKYLTFEQYLEEFDFLWDIFAKENLPKGRLDKYVQSDTGRKGTTTVDEEFLKSIEQWRTYLATSIALRNKSLSVDELNFVVQKTIDRIIFLRMCEDRGVETYGLLRKAAEKGDVYANLFGLFHTADEKYNSGLFDFKEDRITRELIIDNKVLKTIIGELYYPKCEYEFSVMPADILGSVYERFLGRTIRLTAGHQAKVEEKPEVRKAGGVYYTPKYIVDYIVENTVGKLLEGKEPKDVEKLRICDPACGSGSFLIGAYKYLLDWHLKYYTSQITPPLRVERRKGGEALTPDGNLTTAVKKRILLNNIYGVDIDPQAVEVTKLNLLLKALEGETQASINQQMQLFHERVLPNLSHNIQCGNSLIGSDFYDNQFDLFPDQMKKINAFDWQRAFPEVFGEKASSLAGSVKAALSAEALAKEVSPDVAIEKEVSPDVALAKRVSPDIALAKGVSPDIALAKGVSPDVALAKSGFDAVIGNPPYVRQELLGDQKDYFKTHFKVYHGMADLYSYFFERGLQILAKEGLFGIIVANKWMRARYGEPLREWLKKKPIRQIIDFGDLPVFQQATTYPCIFIAGGEAESTFWSTEVKTLDFLSLAEYHENNKKQISRETLNPSGWQLVDDAETILLARLKQNSIPLGEYVKGKIYRGVLTGLNEAFVIDQDTKDRLIAEDPRSAEVIKPFLAGRDIKRYQQPVSDKYLIFTRRGIQIDEYPAVRNYLLQFKEKLMPRPADWKGGEWKGRKPGPYKWYEIQDTVAYWQEFEKPKIIISAINKRGNYTLDSDAIFSNDKTTIIGVEDYFLLGLLNSKACDFFLKSAASTKRGGYFEYKPMYLAPLPVPSANQIFRDHHDQIAHLAISLISINEQILSANLESQRQQLQRAIDHAERRIDELVYELYGLTEEEVAIVEGVSSKH